MTRPISKGLAVVSSAQSAVVMIVDDDAAIFVYSHAHNIFKKRSGFLLSDSFYHHVARDLEKFERAVSSFAAK